MLTPIKRNIGSPALMTQILLDFDNDEFKSEEALLKFIENRWKFVFQFVWPYGRLELKDLRVMRTSNGWHVYLTVANRMTQDDIVFLQLMLGSDYRREAYSYLRLHSGVRDWNFLFQRKYDGDHNIISKEERCPDLTNEIRDKVKSFLSGHD